MRILTQHPRVLASLLLGVLTATAVIYAQAPGTALSAEAIVNATDGGAENLSAVARDADGDSVVAWVGPDAGGTGIYFRRYSYAGTLGTETPANTTTALDQTNPAVAMDASGRLVVAWESDTGVTNGREIIFSLYAADGTAIKSNITVTGQAGEQTEPAVAMSSSGFVITWQGVGEVTPDTTALDIFAQRFDSNGNAAGGQIVVNTTAASSQGSPSIGMGADGSFVIAWDSSGQDGSSRGIYGQKFSSAGALVGTTEFRANTVTAGDQSDASVGMGGGGAFVVAWQGPGASGIDVFAQPYDSSGTAIGGNLSVNDETDGDQTAAEVAVDYSGDFVVVWQGPDLTLGLSTDAFLRRYSSAGAAQAGQAAVHAADAVTDQQRPDVALDADGDYVVGWESDAGGDFDVYGRRFVGPEDIDVGITKDDTTDPVATDSDYAYTLTVENHHAVGATGVGQARGIVVTDTMPTGATGSGSGTNWNCTGTTTITCTYAAESGLAAGASSVITIAAHSPATAPNPTTNPQSEIRNDVTVDSHQNDTNTANDSDSELTAQCDDPDPGKLQFSGATFSAAESSSATIMVTRADGDNNGIAGTCGQVTVAYRTANDGTITVTSAVAGTDYTATSGTLTIDNGDSSGTFSVTLTNDTIDEENETFHVVLENPTTRATLGSPVDATVTITDNDTATMTVVLSPTSQAEDSASTVTATVNLSTTVYRDVVANVACSGGTAEVGDYTCPSTITVTAGQTSGTGTLDPIADTVDEVNETFDVTISSTQLAGTNTKTFTITDDDNPPGLSVADVTVTETDAVGLSATFVVTLSAASEKTVTVDYATSNGSAGGNDYTAVSGGCTAGPPTSLVFNPGDTSKNIAVNITGDTLDENDAETFTFTLTEPDTLLCSSTPLNATITDATATGTINDNDPLPEVTLTVNGSVSRTITEAGAGAAAEALIRATVTPRSGRAITVPLTFETGGSDTPNRGASCTPGTVDFCSATSITIPASGTSGGSAFAEITATSNADTRFEGIESTTIDMDCSTAPCVESGMLQQIELTITDDEPEPSFQFTAASQSVNENAGTATVTVQRSLGTATEVERTMTLAYTTGGSATNPADYTLAPASPLSFAPSDTSKTLTVTLVNDSDNEANETVVLTLQDPIPGTLGANDVHTLTIQNDDTLPQVMFESASSSAPEEQPSSGAPTTAALRVKLSRTDSSNDTVVPFSITMGMGNAASASDYGTFTCKSQNAPEGACSGSAVTINAGDTYADIMIPVTSDNIDESDETVTVVLATPSANAMLVAPSSHTLTITDNDSAIYTIDDPAAVLEGNSGTKTITFTVTRTPSDHATTVGWATANNTATATANPPSPPAGDYEPGNATLNFAANTSNSTQTFTVTINGDTTDESDETFFANLSAASAGTTIGDAQGVGTIADDDVSMSVADVAVTEGSGAGTTTLNFVVTLNSAPLSAVTVDYATAAGSAVQPGDYASASGTLTFNVGETSKTVPVTIVRDDVDESDETLTLTLSNASGATITDGTATGTITDDDTASYTIDDVTVTEGNAGTVTAVFTVTRTASASATTIDYTTVGVSATEGTDYADATGTLNFAASATSSTQTVSVTLNGDLVDEANETYNVNLSNASAGTIADSQGVGTITDNDAVTVSFSAASQTVGESAGTVTVTATRTGATDFAVDVPFTVMSGTAANPADHDAVSGFLTIPASGAATASMSYTFNVVNDTVDEADETVVFTMGTPTGGNVTSAAPTTHTVTITDDDTATVSVVAVASATEGSPISFGLSLSTTSDRPITVTYSTANGTAVAPGDYTAASGATVIIPAGTTTGTSIGVATASDTVDENNETFTITLTAANNGALISGTANTSTGTITDNDTATLSVADVTVTEGTGTGTTTLDFMVSLSTTSASTVTVNYATANGTALQPGDYTTATGTLTFTPGQTSKLVPVTVSRDAIDEANESLTLTLSSASGAAISDGSATGTITDDDNAVVAGDQAPAVVVTQSGGSVNVSTSGGGGGAFSWTSLLGLLSLLGLRCAKRKCGRQQFFFNDVRRRYRFGLKAMLAFLALAPTFALAQNPAANSPQTPSSGLSYSNADFRYLLISVDDPSVDANGFSLGASWSLDKQFFVSGSYSSVETDDFTVSGATGSSATDSFSLGLGWHRPLQPGLDFAGSISLVSSDANGQGGFSGSSDDTGYGLEAGLRGTFTPTFEWGAALSYVAIFDDSGTALSGQIVYHLDPRFSLAAGTGFGDNSPQFNLGARYSF